MEACGAVAAVDREALIGDGSGSHAGRWQRSPEVAHVSSKGRAAIVDLGHPERPPVILEGTAAYLWNLLERPHSVASLCDAAAASFGVDAEEVSGDVTAFLGGLAERGLVRHRGSEPGSP